MTSVHSSINSNRSFRQLDDIRLCQSLPQSSTSVIDGMEESKQFRTQLPVLGVDCVL